MKGPEPKIHVAELNLAALMYSGIMQLNHLSYQDLWEQLPESTRLQIREFVVKEREPFHPKSGIKDDFQT